MKKYYNINMLFNGSINYVSNGHYRGENIINDKRSKNKEKYNIGKQTS